MRRALLLALCLAAVCSGQSAQERKPNRRALLRQLWYDVGTAMTKANLGEKDRKKLDRAREAVSEAADLKNVRASDRDALHKAFEDIRKRSGKFQADDRKAVLDDIDRLRAMGADRQARPRRQAYPPRARPWPSPYPRPRRWPGY